MSDESPLPRLGEVAALIQSRDWTASPLGPRDAWPASLHTVLQLMLGSRYAMWLGWGPELLFFYNDAYAEQTLGPRHPWALGRPAAEVWSEIWDVVGPRVEKVLRTGEATWDDGLLLFLERSGYPEETYHTFSYSAAPGDVPGETCGLFCVVIEETEKVIGARRIALLADFAARLGPSSSVEGVALAITQALTDDARDIPFSLTYLFDEDGRTAHRVAQTGFPAGHRFAPETFALDGNAPWPFAAAESSGTPLLVPLDASVSFPQGAWQRPPKHALILPIAAQGARRPAGMFVAAVSPHRRLDDGYRRFLDLLVGALGAGFGNARAYAQELRRAEALAELDRAKTTFFSNVSHELRTPLTLMLGPTEDALASPERALQGADLETVHRNARRLLKLVNALLDFARIEAGRAEVSYQLTDVGALTADLASSFRSAVERAGLSFEVSCETPRAPFSVDRDMWEKIVFNLLSNALKFTFTGRIGVSLRDRGETVELVVSDTGTGISAGELPRLFERFHRIGGARARTHEGSGIGLALVHDLVRLHGGTITVASRVDEGTTFTVVIPSREAPREGTRPGSSSPPPRVGASTVASSFVEEALSWTTAPSGRISRVPAPDTARREHLVVADDNVDMRDYLVRLLGDRWDVTAVGDGEAALEAMRRRPADLVLTDVMMPRMDGFGLLRAIRNDAALRSVPVILLSARAGEEAAGDGLHAGADDYIVKPFSARDLLVRVASRLAAVAADRAANTIKENLYRHFMQAPFPVAVFRGPTHIVELANDATLRAWSRDASVIGKPLLVALPELVDQPYIGYLDGVVRTGVAYEGRAERAVLTSPDGALEEVYFTFVYAPLRDAAGNTEGVLMSAFDVTAQVQSRLEVERTSRAKDEFLATMSHELRTPLNAMLGWAKLLREDLRDPGGFDAKRLDHGLTVIERNANTQARLVSDLLDVSRIISGKLRLAVHHVSVLAVVSAAVDVVRQAADAKRVRLVATVSPDVGSLLGDADRLQQIVWNLLTNAVKFTPAEGTVEISAQRFRSKTIIRVSDTGAGLAAEDLPVIFERFRQVDSSTTRSQGGLGLGLGIVKHLVEAHGGTVLAESAGPGLGSVFTVSLPIRAIFVDETAVRLPTPQAEPTPLKRAGGGRSLAGAHVLVVDDEEDSRELLRVVLGTEGATVTVAGSAQEALAAASTTRFDLIVSDIGMPERDGYSLMRELRGGGNQAPAIALTAYVRAEDVVRATDAGFQKHLSKPVDARVLLELLVRLLKGKG